MSWFIHSAVTRRGREALIFTAHADDNHAAPVHLSLREVPRFCGISSECQALVRFLAYCRIEPHVPPLVRVPVYSFEF